MSKLRSLLTGIVSATERFSNDHTTSRAMTMAAQLMAAGANQQLIAAKLEEANDIGPESTAKPADEPKRIKAILRVNLRLIAHQIKKSQNLQMKNL